MLHARLPFSAILSADDSPRIVINCLYERFKVLEFNYSGIWALVLPNCEAR